MWKVFSVAGALTLLATAGAAGAQVVVPPVPGTNPPVVVVYPGGSFVSGNPAASQASANASRAAAQQAAADARAQAAAQRAAAAAARGH